MSASRSGSPSAAKERAACPKCGEPMLECARRDGSPTWRCACGHWGPRVDFTDIEYDWAVVRGGTPGAVPYWRFRV